VWRKPRNPENDTEKSSTEEMQNRTDISR